MTRVYSKSWKLLAAAIGMCVMLSACGTSEASEPQEQLPVEQTAKEDAMITPDNFIDTLMKGSKEDIYKQISPELQGIISLDEFKTSVDSFMEGVTSWNKVTEVKLNHLVDRSWKDQMGTKGLQASFCRRSPD
ncbi:hypothetical protein ACFSQ7_25100 [Paenibacillus rhizoplanae]